MHDPNEPQKKSLFLAACKNFVTSVGAVGIAESIFNNKGFRDVLKDKFNLAVIGFGTALGILATSRYNKKVDKHSTRLEEERGDTTDDRHRGL